MSGNKKSLDEADKEQIDANLRRIFEDDAQADLPDDLMALLDRLDDVDIPDPADADPHDSAPAGVAQADSEGDGKA